MRRRFCKSACVTHRRLIASTCWVWSGVLSLFLSWSLFPASLLAAEETAGSEHRLRYLGMHFHELGRKTQIPIAEIGTWRLWDARVSWPHLQPLKGQWRFGELDRLVALAESENLQIILPLGLTPTWAASRPNEPSGYNQPGWASAPRDIADWETYVRKVVSRLAGRVSYFEIWNEPNHKSFFTGSTDEMVRLTCSAYAEIKRINPSAKVISPSPTQKEEGVAWLRQFLSQGGGRCVDIIGFHFYVWPHETPEAILPLYQSLKDVLSRAELNHLPIWNTESGWYIENATMRNESKYRVLSADLAAAYAMRALILGWWIGIERFILYAWDNRNMGYIEPDSKLDKAAARGFSAAAQWITKGEIADCRKERSGLWKCEFSSQLIGDGEILWIEKDGRAVEISVSEKLAKWIWLDEYGEEHSTLLARGSRVKIENRPSLIIVQAD